MIELEAIPQNMTITPVLLAHVVGNVLDPHPHPSLPIILIRSVDLTLNLPLNVAVVRHLHRIGYPIHFLLSTCLQPNAKSLLLFLCCQ
jgi:hypothetical protein